MSHFLFDEFSTSSSKQWKQKIQFDLKGADYNSTLLTHTNDGITIKPFYHSDEFVKTEVSNTINDFGICQNIFISTEKTANYLAIDSLKRGANHILFVANSPFDIDSLLKDIPSTVPIYFEINLLSESFIQDLKDYLKNRVSFLNIDIIGNLSKSGNWFYNLSKDFEILTNLAQNSNSTILSVDVSNYQNAGATHVQQVAYALSHANEYLNYFDSNQIPIESLSINFNVAIGSNYFFEIAKLRAIRALFTLISKEYGFKTKASIFSQPTKRNKTLYDYNTNMLRTTSECMSAILGGSDSVCNTSYDTIYHKKNEFGERIARNQLLILKKESAFINASEFSDGSYYIESLTNEIVQKALAVFKDIEKGGGFLKQLKEGTIQRKIKESAIKEQNQFDANELVLLGTNQHPNMDDKMKENLEVFPFVKTKSRKTLIAPIVAKRLAEKMEQERLKNEA
ncbi:MAG: methylmalonyl-CoA mutase subunit beta [Urechidicola sp.]|nr:methylmalonyl-CoA mutase subunit beta [Urechidicola sp.]